MAFSFAHNFVCVHCVGREYRYDDEPEMKLYLTYADKNGTSLLPGPMQRCLDEADCCDQRY